VRGLLGEKHVVMRFVCCGAGKFDIKVSAPALGIELLVSEHDTTTLKGPKVGGGGGGGGSGGGGGVWFVLSVGVFVIGD